MAENGGRKISHPKDGFRSSNYFPSAKLPQQLSWQLPQLLLALTLLLVLATRTAEAKSFECFTGDKDILRRKRCPSFGAMGFSDVCFKKIGDAPDDIQRGCFNTRLASLITESKEIGCHQIPAKYGTGTICLCDNDLCNDGHSALLHSAVRGVQGWSVMILLVALHLLIARRAP